MIRIAITAATLALVTLSGTATASAQNLRGFAGVGAVRDVNSEQLPLFGGGVLIDLGTPWISAGVQGEGFVLWPYFAGRGAVFGQGNVTPKRGVRPFFLAGVGFGEAAGPLFGGGVEIGPPHGRLGLRVGIEDYLARVSGLDCAAFGFSAAECSAFPHGGNPYTAHQVTFRIGVLFR